VVIHFESGERQVLHLADWAEPALHEFAGELLGSRHIRNVELLEGAAPAPSQPPPLPAAGYVQPPDVSAPLVRRVVSNVITLVFGLLAVGIGIAISFSGEGGCTNIWASPGLCGLQDRSVPRLASLVFLGLGLWMLFTPSKSRKR